MPSKQFDLASAGTPGLVKDRPGYALDPGAFTSAQNVRFADGQVQNFPGWEVICEGDLAVAKPYYLQMIPTEDVYYWAVAGLDDVAASEICISDGAQKIDVTPTSPPVITAADQWSGGFFNGISVLNNGQLNYPIYLKDLGEPTPIYDDLPYDSSDTWRTKQVRCEVMRPFKNFLVAFDIHRNNARYPYMVKWSNAADPGFLPDSWDQTDPTKLAGEQVLAETGGFIVDFKPLGDLGMIYKEDSVWSMSLVGGQYVFRFRQALASVGCLAPNCVTEFRGKHFVLMDGDIIIHNGQSAESIVEKKIKKFLFRTMDTENYRTSFVARHDRRAEIWCCFPADGEYLPNMAAVWNWKDDTWTIRELPDTTAWMIAGVDIIGQTLPVEDPWGGPEPEGPIVPFIAWGGQLDPSHPDYGLYPGGVVPSTPKIWTDRDFNPILRTLVSVGETGIQKQDTNNTYGGAVRRCYAERDGIPLDGQDRNCLVRRAHPLMTGTGPVKLFVGAQPTPGAAVTWDGPHSFTPGVDNFINVRVNGKLLAWRIETEADVAWALQGWRWDYTALGSQ